MIKQLKNKLILAFAAAIIASCQPPSKDGQTISPAQNDSSVGKNLIPDESGYAEVNGLKMYYEVFGKGKPIVLLHGSFMNIPMNWSSFIPLLAKNRKVIVAEMQNKTVAPAIADYTAYKNQLEQVSRNKNTNGVTDAIKQNANIVDNRYKFY